MMPGIVQQRLLQLRQGAGDHCGLQEVRDEQGDHLLHHHRDGRQQVQDILREEPEMSSKPKEKIINRKERGPQLAYLVNRQDGSSLPTPAPQKTWSLLSPARPKKERDEVQEDEAEIMRKTIQEEEKKKNQEEYSYSESKNCTEIPSGDHAYLGSGGVESGLETAAGCSSSSTPPSPPGSVLDVPKEFSPPLSRAGVPPIDVTNGSLYATGHQLRNCKLYKREDDRSSQATNNRGKLESSESSAEFETKNTEGTSGQMGYQT
jgi:hypothetical protein